MILHRMKDGLSGLLDKIPDNVWPFLGLLFLWCATFVLWFFPLTRIVIDAGPKGDSNGMANVMEVFGSIVGLLTIVCSVTWLYHLEEDIAARKIRQAEDAVLAKVDARRELRDREELLGLAPWSTDEDELERYLYELHPLEERNSFLSDYHYYIKGTPTPKRRIRSRGFAKLANELRADGEP